MKIMQGKRGIIMGVANKNSIAWGIAQQLHEAGAEIAFTYVGEALERRVKPLAESIGSDFIVECDVCDDAAIAETVKQVEAKWGKIDFLVHAIAFSDKSELAGRYVDTTRENFKNT
ncbi:MAG: enoyl-[acyl-carrier protein] reductase I, partial [bacterium]